MSNFNRDSDTGMTFLAFLGIILSLAKLIGMICISVAVILVLFYGIANTTLVWWGFGLFVAGSLVSTQKS